MIGADAVLRVLWLFVPAYLANMSPVLVQRSFERLATPIDGGRSYRGKRILGDHKTWMGLGTGVGDAAKSFFKRRVGIAPGASWPVFDQLDFFAGAYVFLAPVYVAPLVPTLACLPIVLAGGVAVTAIGWALGLKEAWI
jgi:CDP-2,3-bis-(O-geranylgeranyl)-sn-glycerol synthase